MTWLNYSPPEGVVTNLMSPEILVLGKTNPGNSKKLIVFGECTLVYIVTRNNSKRRIIPVIDLKEWNKYGGQYFLSVHKVKYIHCIQWEEITIDK